MKWFEILVINTCMCLKEGPNQVFQQLHNTEVSRQNVLSMVMTKCLSTEAKVLPKIIELPFVLLFCLVETAIKWWKSLRDKRNYSDE